MHISSLDHFVGGLLTASWAPGDDTPRFREFVSDARNVFDLYSSEGQVAIEVVSHVALGQPNVATRRSRN